MHFVLFVLIRIKHDFKLCLDSNESASKDYDINTYKQMGGDSLEKLFVDSKLLSPIMSLHYSLPMFVLPKN